MKTLSRLVFTLDGSIWKQERAVRQSSSILLAFHRRTYSNRPTMQGKDERVKRVLVTGASGFIAATIVDTLLAKGYDVRGTVRSLKNEDKVAPLKSLAEGKPGVLELVEADLLDPDCWESAVDGCSHVLHTASPYPWKQPKNADEVVRPAVDGTLSVLRACRDAGTVQRVVVTSSISAVGSYNAGRPLTEEDWTDPSMGGAGAEPYVISKLRAEQEAYKFVKELDESNKFELCSLLPGIVVGPVLTSHVASSLDIVKRMLTGGDPLAASFGMPLVDVRDIADAHIACMTSEKAPGNRFLLVGNSTPFVDVCKFLYEEFHEQGYSPPTRLAPWILVRLMALFDEDARTTCLLWGLKMEYDNSKMKNILGITPRDTKQAVIDMAYSLIENGYIEKRPKYKGRPSKQ